MVSTVSSHDLKENLQQLKKAYLNLPYPSEALRRQQLIALKRAILDHQDKLIKALAADFGHRSHDESKLADIMPTLLAIDHTLKHLREWMKPEKRKVGLLFQPATSRIIYQPLGVIGIMSPWNYPVFLSLGPLIAAIAAGNKAMIKPSEFTPYANRILADIIKQAFSLDEVRFIEGDAKVAAEFSALPFDHLIFTGSTQVGKLVMAAAAQNLTPVTLELGGKSPAIVAPDVTADFAVTRMLYGKCLNAGQTCVAPDYVLCPDEKMPALINAFKEQFKQLYPNPDCGDFTSIVTDQQFERLNTLLADAKEKGATLLPVTEQKLSQTRMMPLTLVTNVNHTMKIMQEEIFGPLLPIVGYKTIDSAISYINKQARPLALYLFTLEQKIENQVLSQTHAGGVCINDTVNHVAQDDLPFGGVGPSGLGQYHAIEGFKTFSACKPVLKRGRFYSAKTAFPPYGKLVHKFIYKLLFR